MANHNLIVERWERQTGTKAEFALVRGGFWYSRVLGVCAWERIGAFDANRMRDAIANAGYKLVELDGVLLESPNVARASMDGAQTEFASIS